jgi:SSS family solute:Na+ symporter
MAARALSPHLADTQQALPLILTSGVPFAVGGLALAAILSAEMSAADAVLFMLSTSAARDFYRGYIRREATDGQVLRVARLTAIASGALGFGLTFLSDSVITALSTFYALLGVTLFAPLVGALYLRRVHPHAALASMVAGIAVWAFIREPVGWIPDWMTPGMLGLIASTTVFLAVSALPARR